MGTIHCSFAHHEEPTRKLCFIQTHLFKTRLLRDKNWKLTSVNEQNVSERWKATLNPNFQALHSEFARFMFPLKHHPETGPVGPHHSEAPKPQRPRHAEGDKKRIRSDTRVRWPQGHGAQDHLFITFFRKSRGESQVFFQGNQPKHNNKKHQNPPSFLVWNKKTNLRKLGTKKFVQLFTSTNIIFPILTHQNAPNRLFETSGFFGVQDLIRWDQSSIR